MGLTELTWQPRYSSAALYTLLAGQVKSYHRHYRMGENSSVPVEVAQELLASVQYTLALAGEGGDPETALARGREILTQRLEQARQLHRLTAVTGDRQNQWRWEALEALGRYLDRYDLLHFAHRIPETVFYPPPVPVPGSLQGVDWACCYLNSLWLEDQILYSFSEQALKELYANLPPDYWEAPETICEQPLWNALGRKLLGLSLDSLLLSGEQRQAIAADVTPGAVARAEEAVCQELALPEHPAACAKAVMDRVKPRLLAALPNGALSRIFLG